MRKINGSLMCCWLLAGCAVGVEGVEREESAPVAPEERVCVDLSEEGGACAQIEERWRAQESLPADEVDSVPAPVAGSVPWYCCFYTLDGCFNAGCDSCSMGGGQECPHWQCHNSVCE